MSKLLFLTLIFTSIIECSLGQNMKSRVYQVKGTINADTGKVSFRLLADKSFYPKDFIYNSSEVKNRKFQITGTIPYPIGLGITDSSAYLSSMFMIEAGNQFINIDLDSSRTVPEVQNAVMKEYYTSYLPFFSSTAALNGQVDKKWRTLIRLYPDNIPDSVRLSHTVELKKSYARTDSTLLAYTRLNPHSYLALWKLVELTPFGYQPIFDTIYNHFSNDLKNTHTGKVLGKKIESFKSLTGPGRVFPTITCLDSIGKLMPSIEAALQKYTFVDFWYSNCSPCIAQFPGLIAVYDDYKNKGLEIIGISTDKSKYRSNWIQAIKKYNINWPQYWDRDGKEAVRLNITAFPTNFLLDGEGRIIAQNLNYVELRSFLEQNLKQH